jgi:aspartokinase
MRTTTDAVREILFHSDVPLEALRSGILNLSAYAEQILPEVEKLSWKTVQKNTVVVALSRLANEVTAVPPLQPEVILDELSIKAPLADFTFERTDENLKKAQQLPSKLGLHNTQFFTVTQGINEITVIVSQERADEALEYLGVPPKAIFRNLVGITMRFREDYLGQPNVIYALLARLAKQRINLLEIVSTYTELTAFIEEHELDKAVAVLNKSMAKE